MAAAFCSSCGESLLPGDQFCVACGERVATDSPSPEPSEEASEDVVSAPVALSITKPVKLTPKPTASPASEAAPAATAATNRRLVVGLVAVLGVLVLLVGGVGIGAMIAGAGQGNNQSSGVVSDPLPSDSIEGEADSATDTSTDNSTTTDGGSGTVTPARVEFASISGNIRCRIEASGVTCHMGEHTYAKPPQACTSGPKGTTVGLDQSGITWPCLSSDIVTTNVLPYDTNINAHNYDCSINYVTGVTCVNSSKQGFQMEYDNGITGVG